MALKAGEVTLHFPSPKHFAEFAFQQEGSPDRHEVRGGPHANQDQYGGEHPCSIGVHGDLLAVAHGGQGDRRHEERPDEAGIWIDDREADDTDERHQQDERECSEHASPQVEHIALPLVG